MSEAASQNEPRLLADALLEPVHKVRFVRTRHGKRNQIQAYIGTHPALPCKQAWQGNRPQAGEVWEVSIAYTSRGGIHFLRPLRRLMTNEERLVHEEVKRQEKEAARLAKKKGKEKAKAKRQALEAKRREENLARKAASRAQHELLFEQAAERRRVLYAERRAAICQLAPGDHLLPVTMFRINSPSNDLIFKGEAVVRVVEDSGRLQLSLHLAPGEAATRPIFALPFALRDEGFLEGTIPDDPHPIRLLLKVPTERSL